MLSFADYSTVTRKPLFCQGLPCADYSTVTHNLFLDKQLCRIDCFLDWGTCALRWSMFPTRDRLCESIRIIVAADIC